MNPILLALLSLGCPPQSATSYSYGAAYSYAAPTYQAYAAATAYYTPVVKEIQFISLQQPYYGSLVGGYARAQQREDKLEATLERLADRVDSLSRPAPQPVPQLAPQPVPQLAPQPASPPYYAPQPSPQQPVPQYAPQPPAKGYPPAPQSPEVPAKGFGPGPAPGPGFSTSAPTPPPVDPTVSYAPSIPTALGRCAQCHTGEAAKGGIALFDAPGRLADLRPEDWAQVDDAVTSGRMPKGGPPLSLAEYRELGGFIRNLITPAATATASAGPRNPY
jgi:hypothetical protein